MQLKHPLVCLHFMNEVIHPIIQFKFFFFSAPSFLAIFCVCNEEYCRIVWYEPSCVDQNENEGNHPNQKGNGGKNPVLN